MSVRLEPRPFAAVGLPLGLTLMLGAVAACGESGGGPIDGKQSTNAAAANVERALSQAGKALAFTFASDGTLAKTAGATGSSTSAVAAPMMGDGLPPAMLKAMVGPALTAQATGVAMPSMMTTEEKLDQIGAELRRLMNERLFVDSNLESNDAGTATYLLRPDPTCRPLPADDAPPGTVPDIDPKCAMDFTKVDVRVAVSKDGDGARLRFLIGTQRLELVVFIVHSDLLAVEEDLPQTQAAVDEINAKLGTNDSPTGTYDRLAGKIRSSVQLLAANKVRFAVSILEAVDVAKTGGARFTSAATDPLYAVTGDGTSRRAQLELGLGTTVAETTWDPKGTGVTNRDERVTIGGVYGRYDLDESTKTITVTDVGVGETMVAVRGETIFDLGLNLSSMRRFSGFVRVNADDSTHLELTPKLDLTLAFDYQAVASELASAPSMAVAHDSYEVALDNGGAPTAVDTVAKSDTFAGGLRVAAGQLTLSAASTPTQTVTVPAGKCLTSSSGGAPAGTNAFLGALVVSDCP